jgi:hypothetical protein
VASWASSSRTGISEALALASGSFVACLFFPTLASALPGEPGPEEPDLPIRIAATATIARPPMTAPTTAARLRERCVCMTWVACSGAGAAWVGS